MVVEADGRCVPANQPVRNRVERARPGDSDRRWFRVPRSRFRVHSIRTWNWNREPGTQYALRAACHLECRAASEGKQQDALGLRARLHEMRHAMRERVRLSRAGAGDDQERAGTKLSSLLLLNVQNIERGRMGHGVTISRLSPFSSPFGPAPNVLSLILQSPNLPIFQFHNSRSATGIGRRAALMAGNNPPINPISSA